MNCRERRGGVALKHGLHAGGATRVVKTADNELAFQSGGERLIDLA
jgi:hypothetical protein